LVRSICLLPLQYSVSIQLQKPDIISDLGTANAGNPGPVGTCPVTCVIGLGIAQYGISAIPCHNNGWSIIVVGATICFLPLNIPQLIHLHDPYICQSAPGFCLFAGDPRFGSADKYISPVRSLTRHNQPVISGSSYCTLPLNDRDLSLHFEANT